ncbi:Transcription initiation factor IIA large subunit [Lachnellula occidentalis]|uniref:Transcription initiation factor IIA large subunit n=1 Tax=Lachnellula occidentalis TaxID=215460 RepID=A0A8H8S4V6_9HELO|nr:Transcription initiation factor IIA large subunit [Lachnellula occidentalis]
MSNTQVGNVYQQIIADVVESSRVDFEEGGVDDNVLEELRLGWQTKLSGLNVATFPWDPKIEPPIANPPTVPSNAGNYHSINTPPQNMQGQPMQQMQPMPSNGNPPRIKPEPGVDSPPMTQPPYQHGGLTMPQMPMAGATTAQQRAAQHLQANYGQRAAASINAIQSAQQPPQQPPTQQGAPFHPAGQAFTPQQMQMQMHQQQQARAQLQTAQQPQQMSEQQYKSFMAAQQAQAQARAQAAQAARQNAQNGQMPQNGQNGFNGAPPQTDGADDVEAETVIKQIGSNGEEITMGRVEIDGLIRSKIESMGQSMEGGGLMLPLSELKKKSKSQSSQPKRTRTRKAKEGTVFEGMIQVDGGDSDDDVKEEHDEDAINSDLDDPDDGLNDEEDEDEGMGHIMLCMYDKVQRVKNKWKCVMKDGVLTVNGKEYVFHKAQGEYEW